MQLANYFDLFGLFSAAGDRQGARGLKHSLHLHNSGNYTRSTVVDGLSVLCEAVSLVNEWRW